MPAQAKPRLFRECRCALKSHRPDARPRSAGHKS
jgi:hypothetical protein